ncbi:hypothetical protein F5887DRAFT_62000 [Amanita rubescens]|nr:hypothetical protein F5887DRAFT_62341 [Amanita rubescens]KAF8331219.1 hypothetical protein F5887DRAFT_62000 [Amanita rubescens]
MAFPEHACIESLAKYGANLSGRENVAKQPVFIQRLSTALERAYTVRISCGIKPQEDCCLCQIANKINTVADRASHLQVNERSWRRFLGYFSIYSSDQLNHALEGDCYNLIQILEAYCSQTLTNHALATFVTAHQAVNQPSPSSVPTVIASEMFKNACDINIKEGRINNIAGDVDMYMHLASPTTNDWKLPVGPLLMLFAVAACSLTLAIVSKN